MAMEPRKCTCGVWYKPRKHNQSACVNCRILAGKRVYPLFDPRKEWTFFESEEERRERRIAAQKAGEKIR